MQLSVVRSCKASPVADLKEATSQTSSLTVNSGILIQLHQMHSQATKPYACTTVH